MQWKGHKQWAAKRQSAEAADGYIELYKKVVGNLQFYTVLRSGHMVSFWKKKNRLIGIVNHRFISYSNAVKSHKYNAGDNNSIFSICVSSCYHSHLLNFSFSRR